MTDLLMPQDVLFGMIERTVTNKMVEVCGALIGRRGLIEYDQPMSNIGDFPDSEFCFDPMEQLELWKKAEEAHLSILGIYHSHVRGEAYPSPVDVHLAVYPKFHYVILTQRAIRAFKIVDSVVSEDKIVLNY